MVIIVIEISEANDRVWREGGGKGREGERRKGRENGGGRRDEYKRREAKGRKVEVEKEREKEKIEDCKLDEIAD